MSIHERVGQLIEQLDTAAGMLTVASMRDAEVNEAKEKVMGVSAQLGDLVNELLDDGDDLGDLLK